jgi:hypothetical protein
VHGLSYSPSYQELIGRHTRRIWNDANGTALIEAFSMGGMAHGVPLATTMGAESCGAVGAFFLDVGISITSHASGVCTNLSLKCRVSLGPCQHRFRLLTARPSSLAQPPKARRVR